MGRLIFVRAELLILAAGGQIFVRQDTRRRKPADLPVEQAHDVVFVVDVSVVWGGCGACGFSFSPLPLPICAWVFLPRWFFFFF